MQVMEIPFSRFCTCDICEKTELTDRTILPDKWVSMWDYNYILCDECVARWIERYKEFPVYFEKGKGWSEYSSIPEDSTHWGQANFELV